ncbi:MAG: LPS export ABC transporter periplasmic protein LptC [Deltaproteobacteria bacterium]|nr:LPS export ABC transporter periplasmic protein LptC [Deltaproteobacteria bacterium]
MSELAVRHHATRLLGTGRRLQFLRRAFVVAGALYLALVVSVMALRSQGRGARAASFGAGAAEEASAGKDSKLHLQDFYRVQTREGRKSWELRATDAKFFPDEGVTYVNSAQLLLKREDGSTLTLTSDSAKLYMEGELMDRAELQGNVVVQSEDSVTLATQFAVFRDSERLITAPGEARISGPGYQVDGEELELFIDRDEMNFGSNVRSQFARGSKMPDLNIKGNRE